ncbi:hypothetical protein OG373_02840 [Streptomyces avidinii]|uniref:hypothetical protein n=1 Tax=Streptomyces avidinii TaxID=1895 RepID=UPI0038699846|nr:hypothetical protein OG373_02840 [Streptomyces avidinii]
MPPDSHPSAALDRLGVEWFTVCFRSRPYGLRAAGVQERIAARVSRETAGALRDDGMPAEAVATALGTTRSKAPWSCS